jgi:hypothetical protein
MIIVSLFGGLGNQMFQYACGKAIATRLSTELKLDTSYLTDRTPRNNFTFRDFELGVFNLQDQVASFKEIRNFVPDLWNSSKIAQQFYRVVRLLNGNNYYFEKQKYFYENRIVKVKDNTYLYGYFQTERYYSDYRNEILTAFSLKSEIDLTNRELINTLQSENSVSVHIRRGDYELTPFNLLGIESYYRKAIETILQQVENPKFYFFTNDYKWTEENFIGFDIEKTIIKHNQGNRSFLDLVLMSNCKHNICANSSFSWWSAWLNQHPEKLIIAPNKWFKDLNTNNDLIPENWIKV